MRLYLISDRINKPDAVHSDKERQLFIVSVLNVVYETEFLLFFFSFFGGGGYFEGTFLQTGCLRVRKIQWGMVVNHCCSIWAKAL